MVSVDGEGGETGVVEHGRKILMKNMVLSILLVCTVSYYPAPVYLVLGLSLLLQ